MNNIQNYYIGFVFSDSKFILGIRRSAVAEILLFLISLTFLSYLLGDGTRFIDVSPHPFWIILLLIAVQYGTNEALLCTLLATLFLLAGNIPEQHFGENSYDYLFRLVYHPFLWLGTSVIIGELRTRQIHERTELKNDLVMAEQEAKAITSAYNHLKTLKEGLETRLVSELRSSIGIYEAAKSLESLNQSRILLAVEEVIISAMRPAKFSIFALGSNGFEAVTCYGWDENDAYTRRFASKTPLYMEVVGQKRVFCTVNEEDEKILSSEGMIAGPLMDPVTGQIFGLLKIEELGFMELNISNIETFKVLCEWIGMAYANAGKYQEAQDNSMVNRDYMLLSYNFLKRQTDLLTALADRIGFDFSKIIIKLTNSREMSDKQYKKVATTLGNVVQSALYEVDQVFEGKKKGSEFTILLPGTSPQNAQALIDRIQGILRKNNDTDIKKAKYSFTVVELYNKNNTSDYEKIANP